MACYDIQFTDEKWIEYQLKFLEKKACLLYRDSAKHSIPWKNVLALKILKQKLSAFQISEQ